MSKHFYDYTENMTQLMSDIITSLGQLPIEQREYLFGDEGEEDMDFMFMVACYIVMEYIKYSFDYDDPVYSLRHFIQIENDTDDERMKWKRVLEYVLKYKKRELERLGITLPPEHKFADIDMSDIQNKLQGYRLTEMNFFEMKRIHGLELVKSVVEKRIGSSKKIPVPRFKNIFVEYDEFIQGLIEDAKKSDKAMVFNSIAFFTLQWHYPVEMFYEIASIMEENDIQDIDVSSVILLCGNIQIESMFHGWIPVQSRMVKERTIFLEPLLNKEISPFYKSEVMQTIKELLGLAVVYKDGMTAIDGDKSIDWFRKKSSIEDWASFLRCYDIFAIWQKKEWTPKKIQYMRKLFDATTVEKL